MAFVILQDLYCVLIRRYTRDVERQRSEGDDGESETNTSTATLYALNLKRPKKF